MGVCRVKWEKVVCNCVCVRKPPQHTTHTNIFVFNVVCNHLGVVVNVPRNKFSKKYTYFLHVHCGGSTDNTRSSCCSCVKTKEGTIRRVPLLNVLYVKYQTRTAFHSAKLSSKTTSSSAPVMHVHVFPFARTEKRINHVFLGTLLREYNHVH